VTDDRLYLWTVYANPTDFPGQYVARRWEARAGDREPVPCAECIVRDTLDEVRADLPPGLYCMPRDPGDDPTIVETWL
jgi:hypothetical protein